MARLLLDTHIVLWWLQGDRRLTESLIALVRNPNNETFVSQSSLWEMAIKVSLGRLSVDLQVLQRTIPAQGFRWLTLSNHHFLAVAELETHPHHRDPFDRLLVAQSRSEPMLLLTADRQLECYGSTVRLF
jgi:PIN domain nuclease of toxin-antitoxin system